MGIRWQITSSKIEFHTISELQRFKILGRRLCSPSLKDVAWLEYIQLIFLIFHTFVCKFGWVDERLDTVRGKKFYRQMYEKFKKLDPRLLAKLHPSNLVNTIFYLVF